MAQALELAMQNLDQERSYILDLKQYMRDQLKSHFPGCTFNGACSDDERSTYTLLNVNIPCEKGQGAMLLFNLDLRGIACSAGSACQSGSQTGSHVLKEILTDEQLSNPSIRFSFSKFNTRDCIDRTVKALVECLSS
jgi:cysteine desulfurase